MITGSLCLLAGSSTASQVEDSEPAPTTMGSSSLSTIEYLDQHSLTLHHNHVLTTSSNHPWAAATEGGSVRSRSAPAWRDVERRTSATACNSAGKTKPAGEAHDAAHLLSGISMTASSA